MKKLKCVFVIDRDNNSLAIDKVYPGNEWVLAGEGIATIKFDGTSTIFLNGCLHKRWDRRLKPRFHSMRMRLGDRFVFQDHMLKDVPDGAIPCEESPDLVTYHHPHWVPVKASNPEDVYFIEALNNTKEDLIEGQTYEMVGPTIRNNLHEFSTHTLIKHGSSVVSNLDRSFLGIKSWLELNYHEGIVFHRGNGDMAKIRRKDFGILWNDDHLRK